MFGLATSHATAIVVNDNTVLQTSQIGPSSGGLFFWGYDKSLNQILGTFDSIDFNFNFTSGQRLLFVDGGVSETAFILAFGSESATVQYNRSINFLGPRGDLNFNAFSGFSSSGGIGFAASTSNLGHDDITSTCFSFTGIHFGFNSFTILGGSWPGNSTTLSKASISLFQSRAFAIIPAGKYGICGRVSGLLGSGLVLQNNAVDNLAIVGSTGFAFPATVVNSSSYNATVLTQPSSPSQTCTVSNSAGNVNSAEVTNIQVDCVTDTFSIGGTVMNMIGTGLVLQVNGGDNLTLNSNGGFTFATSIADGSQYAVTIMTQPSNESCSVFNGNGTLAGANISNVIVDCGKANFDVNKAYTDDNQTPVNVTLICTNATVTAPISRSVTPGVATRWVVSSITANAACSASENSVPTGYTQNSTSCTAVAVSAGGTTACTITNTQNPVTVRATKNFTGNSGIEVTFVMTCPGGGTITTIDGTATDGTAAEFEVVDFPWDGTVCTVTEPNVPDFFYIQATTCEDLGIVPSDEDTLCTITNAPTIASFHVSKDFNDDNPLPVEVGISCNSGLPLSEQTTIRDDGDPDGGVTLVVTTFINGELDCEITETPVAGYAAEYQNISVPATSDVACFYTTVVGGAEHSCVISNQVLPVAVDVTKQWITLGTGGDKIDKTASIRVFSPTNIDGGDACFSSAANENGYCKSLAFSGPQTQTQSVQVLPQWQGVSVLIDETVFDDAIETVNECDGSVQILPAQGAACTITNTVFFEGIPALNRYGLAILALLMLGGGLIGFRHFV